MLKIIFQSINLKILLKKNYEQYDDKDINDLYSTVKTIGCYQFFREEYNYRTMKLQEKKGTELSCLNEYIKSKSNENLIT